ncbi:MAG TPA: TIGR03086 family metal-binding protein [Nocardioides sp.]|uniref:TIGR03086 family metal-binding protein n=1 Tax=Nocardioides sp. TaxID=35761 RepID=UPI002E36D4DD|nr:TIGR03086 family metal-binding protein [Nocardioides sp.]HEX5090601.1 TIGR03086 family metal-binding protein [Nocardioides sp.]
MELGALHERTVGEWTRMVEGLDASHWGRPTPCTDWTVRDLVNHVVGEELWTVPLVHGATIEEVGDRFDGDLLGDDPVARARAAAQEAAAAVHERMPSGGTVHLSYGEEQLGEYVHQLAADHLVHAWDLAMASGQDAALDPELVDALSGWFADREDLYRSAGVIGARVADPGDDAQSRLIVATGRDPGWSTKA